MVVFFPVTLLFGVSKYLFTALALAVVISLFASYFVAVSVVPLYCAHALRGIVHHREASEIPDKSWGVRFRTWFNDRFERMLGVYDRWVQKTLDHPKAVVWGFLGVFILSFCLYPLVGLSFFPRTDAGQFVINLKAPTGTRLEVTEDYVKKVENIVRQVVRPGDLHAVVSNIGVMPDLSALTTPNSAMHTAFIQVGLKEDHEISSFVYMAQVRSRTATELAATAHLLPIGRIGRLGPEPGNAGSD